MEENIDIYDDNGEFMGMSTKTEVKQKGFWHNTFHCWVIIQTERGHDILFQKRHDNKKINPGKFATSAGGHIISGETIEEGIRELHEELGIFPLFEQLIPLGIYKEVAHRGRFYNRENQHMFLYISSLQLEDFTFQQTEISGLCVIDSNDFADLIKGNIDLVSVKEIGIDVDGMIEKTYEVNIFDFIGEGTPFMRFSSDAILKAIDNI